MKKIACWMATMILGAAAACAQRNVLEDESAESALLTWSDPSAWQVGFAYSRVSRPVLLDGVEADLDADIAEATIGFSPWGWLLFYGQAGASLGRLDPVMAEDADAGASGLLGARANLWQLYEGVQVTAWRVTLQLAGQYAVRGSRDAGEGELQWGEALVMLPLDYHLSFGRTFRNSYMAEFQSLHFFVGPAFSALDGTWTRNENELDFEETESFGVVGGLDLWLLENLSFGGRVDWFDGASMQLSVLYRF